MGRLFAYGERWTEEMNHRLGCQTENFSEQWKRRQVEEAREVVENLVAMEARVSALPSDKSEARKLLAVQSIVEISQIVAEMKPKDLSPLQLQAAMLRGRGFTHTEVADALDVPGGAATVHSWDATMPAFRKAVGHWRRITEEDQWSMAIREIDQVSKMTDDPALLLKLAKLRIELGYRPEEREAKLAELILREREIMAKERSAPPPSSLAPFPITDPFVEADFTAEDVDADEEGDEL